LLAPLNAALQPGKTGFNRARSDNDEAISLFILFRDCHNPVSTGFRKDAYSIYIRQRRMLDIAKCET